MINEKENTQNYSFIQKFSSLKSHHDNGQQNATATNALYEFLKNKHVSRD